MEKWWGKRYDRAQLKQLYGADLRENPIRITLLGGKPHEQALAADIAVRRDVPGTTDVDRRAPQQPVPARSLLRAPQLGAVRFGTPMPARHEPTRPRVGQSRPNLARHSPHSVRLAGFTGSRGVREGETHFLVRKTERRKCSLRASTPGVLGLSGKLRGGRKPTQNLPDLPLPVNLEPLRGGGGVAVDPVLVHVGDVVEQLLGGGVLRALRDVVGRALLDDLALVHDEDASPTRSRPDRCRA